MNRVVREQYPVEKLPEDLQEMFPGAHHVRLVVESSDANEHIDLADEALADEALAPPDRIMSLEELFALRRPPYRTTEEIVTDIRQQRDEWDD